MVFACLSHVEKFCASKSNTSHSLDLRNNLTDSSTNLTQLHLRQEEQEPHANSKDLKVEWLSAMDVPKKIITDRFARLTLCGRPVKVVDKASEELIKNLHHAFTKIDSNYDPEVRDNTSFHKKMPALYDFFVKHVTLTPYSVHYQKCGNKKCIH